MKFEVYEKCLWKNICCLQSTSIVAAFTGRRGQAEHILVDRPIIIINRFIQYSSLAAGLINLMKAIEQIFVFKLNVGLHTSIEHNSTYNNILYFNFYFNEINNENYMANSVWRVDCDELTVWRVDLFLILDLWRVDHVTSWLVSPFSLFSEVYLFK